jgi:4-amino-4-deoxy-L-arabinose transferase-like glycosyltransferase
MNRSLRHVIPAFFVLLVAFACRLHALDAAWVDNDRTYPHAQGITILDALASLQFNQLPLLSLHITVGIRNGAGASYLLALAGIFDRSMFAGIFMELLLSMLAVAMTFALTRRLWGDVPAFIASLLMATSPWAVYYARGTWVQGSLEFFTVAAAWLAWPALQKGKPRRLISAFAVAALAFQTYLAAFGIIAQLTLSTVLAFQRRLARSIVVGLLICLASVLLYVAMLASSPDGVLMEKIRPLFERGTTPAEAATPNPNASLLEQRFTRDPFAHALRLVSGRDYMTVWTNREDNYPLRHALNETRAVIAELLMLAGAIALILRIQRDPMARVVLGWFALPVAAGFIAAASSTFDLQPMYLLLASPAGYMLAGAAWLLLPKPIAIKRVAIAMLGVLALANVVLASVAFVSAANTVYRQPYAGSLGWLPLRWGERIGAVLRAQCSTINDSTDVNRDQKLWLTTWNRASRNVQMESARFKNDGDVWAVQPQGGNCVLLPSGTPAPANAEALPVTFDDGTQFLVYRSLPYTRTEPMMSVNLGWSLLSLSAPESVNAGDEIAIRQDFRIDTLPAEPHDAWLYQPYVKLLNAQREVVAQADNGAALLGWGWQPGALHLNTVRLRVPSDLAAGEYTLEISLFDPNEKKNAVYFDPVAPDTPIVTIQRRLLIR